MNLFWIFLQNTVIQLTLNVLFHFVIDGRELLLQQIGASGRHIWRVGNWVGVSSV